MKKEIILTKRDPDKIKYFNKLSKQSKKEACKALLLSVGEGSISYMLLSDVESSNNMIGYLLFLACIFIFYEQ